MQYFVYVRRGGRPKLVRDCLLPGVIPDRVVDLLTARSAEDLGLCCACELASRCHVMGLDEAKTRAGLEVYSHYCPVLFHDVFRPRFWKVAELA